MLGNYTRVAASRKCGLRRGDPCLRILHALGNILLEEESCKNNAGAARG